MALSKITIGNNSKSEVLSLLGKSIDEEGYLVESTEPSERILTPEGEEIAVQEWAGLRRGSEAFVKSDFVSLVDVAKRSR